LVRTDKPGYGTARRPAPKEDSHCAVSGSPRRPLGQRDRGRGRDAGRDAAGGLVRIVAIRTRPLRAFAAPTVIVSRGDGLASRIGQQLRWREREADLVLADAAARMTALEHPRVGDAGLWMARYVDQAAACERDVVRHASREY